MPSFRLFHKREFKHESCDDAGADHTIVTNLDKSNLKRIEITVMPQRCCALESRLNDSFSEDVYRVLAEWPGSLAKHSRITWQYGARGHHASLCGSPIVKMAESCCSSITNVWTSRQSVQIPAGNAVTAFLFKQYIK